MTIPGCFNLEAAAQRMIDGPCLANFEGDSLYSTNDDRMDEGIIKHYHVNQVAGWIPIGGEQLWDVGLNAGNGSRTATAREDNWYSGTDKTVAPIGTTELAWSGNEGDGSGVHRITLNDTLRQWFPGGDPFSNVALNADFAYFADPSSVTQLRFRGRRSGDQSINNFDNVDVSSAVVGGEIKRYEVAIPVAVNAAGNLPSMDIITATGVNENAKKWWPLFCRIYRPGVTGTHFCFLGSRGGWQVSDHISNNATTGRCSDARRTAYYRALTGGAPMPMIFWHCLGSNNLDYVSVPQYTGLLQSLVDNRRATCPWPNPLFVLESPYPNTNVTSIGGGIAQAMFNVSQANGDVAFINSWELALHLGVATGFTLGGDDLHQNATGATYYPAITWALLRAMYTETGRRRIRGRMYRPL